MRDALRSILRGAASAFDLFGPTLDDLRRPGETGAQADARALAGDWRAVGDDLRAAMRPAVEVRFEIDRDGYRDLERLKETLDSPNLATAIYNAVRIVLELYDYQGRGYELRLSKSGETLLFRLPGPIP